MATRLSTAAFDLNPRFVFLSPIRTPVADRTQMAEHVDHAIIALDGRAPFAGDVTVELLSPATDAGALRVELWVNDLDDYTCTYGFLVTSPNGQVPYARGERSVVNVDQASRPAKWTSDSRVKHENLLKDLPAYG